MALPVRRLFALLIVLFVLPAMPAMAGQIWWNFDSGPGPGLTLFADAGFGMAWDSGWEVFTKDDGTATGWARLVTDASFSGDFTAVTVANRIDLSGGGALGLVAFYTFPPVGDVPFADAYFNGSGHVTSFVHDSGTHYAFGEADDTSSTAWLRLQRTGTTVITEYCPYSATVPYGSCVFVPLASLSDPHLAAPVRIGLYLGQETPYSGTAGGRFDILVVDANSIPEPATTCLLGAGVLVLACLRLRSARRRK